MTMATPGNNSQIQDLLPPADDDDYDPYAISNEIEAVRKEFNQKFKPLKRGVTVEETALAYNKLVSEIGGTILSLLRDTAHQQGQLAVMVDNIGDGTNEEEATQLLPDDAQLLLEVIAYASETVNASLAHEGITAEQRTILEAVQQRVVAAKQLVEESTLEDEDDDEDTDEAVPQVGE